MDKMIGVILLVSASMVLGQDGNSRVLAGQGSDGPCQPGLRLQENGGCIDVNECIEIQPCKVGQICRNLYGTYLCMCHYGYKLDNVTGDCTDIDECAIGYCGSGQKCINTIGSFDCACSPGLTKIGRFCRDINECKDHPCDDDQYCINTRGSYKCRCKAGYTDMLDGTCTDTDECMQGMCSATGETCHNFQGGYECLCSEGYTKTAGRYCTDVNECDLDMCGEHSECINTHGSFYCRCHRGFTKVNGVCKDNQDCSLGEGTKCQWECQNMPGTYQCVCPSGYDRLDFACIDKNECDLNNKLCGHGNMCINTHGDHKCVAPAPCPSKTFYRKHMKTDEFSYSQVITNTCNRKRCRKVANDRGMYGECKSMPLSISQHYVDITSGLVGPKDLLKMKFPARRRRQEYNFSIVEGDTSMFTLRQPSMYQPHAYLMLAGTSSGPAQYKVKVDMSTYNSKGQMRDNRMLSITIYVSEYEF